MHETHAAAEAVILHSQVLWLIPTLPLLGFLIAVAAERVPGLVKITSPVAVLAAFAVTVAAAAALFAAPPGARLSQTAYTWMTSGPFHADVAFRFDALSAVMALFVTGVGLLIHVYSVGYMAHDDCCPRFFAYMNLFMFAMLLLVLGDNLLVLFVGWEGVGLCSYLLIGFWYENDDNAAAGKKAFIVNRIGDMGFVLGLFLLAWSLAPAAGGVLDLGFAHIEAHAASLAPGTATVIALLLLFGATGKSAQIPLYVWLPDAMAGPTPVSALIHAATMVTAGVYMIARLNVVYMLSPAAMQAVAVLGAATAFFAATIALVQNDIKKVLAYSTVSQIGFMMLALGVGAFATAVFHVMTHAFFKGLLFLGAGSVIHGMGGEQDVRKMGGLRTRMPVTFWTFAAATLAIAGAPGFAGFFSKDEILYHTWAGGHPWLWLVATAAATLTAFYMFRVLFLTFFGELRADPDTAHHVHESPPVMTIPLAILAVLSIVGGWVGLPEHWLWGNRFGGFLAPVTGHPHLATGGLLGEGGLMVIATTVAFAGAALAYVFYLRRPDMPATLSRNMRGVYELLLDKYRIDELYDATVVTPYVRCSTFLWKVADQELIDGFVNGVAGSLIANGDLWRRLQTGNVQHYALVFLGGVVAVLAYYVIR
ncbi:MAG: NADH-quinone oxidoreductase subunit L [Polyangiaceae bacterium UTPRO1]|jgi:NADH-quinone oxidoreductase subunit L|nr:NADH-quinone oxidoreductase subunit L [Myxococcales bacterium]OQY69278.1 MAG: NADH-quinone oxidoreductase subunit L [Polyangiaceae bacterium UTPRO1]